MWKVADADGSPASAQISTFIPGTAVGGPSALLLQWDFRNLSSENQEANHTLGQNMSCVEEGR